MASSQSDPVERPTLDTVARAAGVSRMTVSNAYNRPDQISAVTRTRVLAVADALGYGGPHPTAASLRLGRTDTIGVVLTERLPFAFTDPGLVMILHGIAAELSDSGNALLLVPGAGADGGPPLRHALVDGLILCSLAADDPAVAAAQARRVPLVTVGHPRLPRVPLIGPDNRATAGLVAEHLLALGHRRLTVLTTHPTTGPARPVFAERVEGFRTAARAGGPGVEVDVVQAADNLRDAGRVAMTTAWSRSDRLRESAVFAVTDLLGLGVLDAAAAAGLAVPADLSVAGYDGIAEAAASSPPLTTVTQDLFGQGRAAARLVRRLVEGGSARSPRWPAELSRRGSTGAAPR